MANFALNLKSVLLTSGNSQIRKYELVERTAPHAGRKWLELQIMQMASHSDSTP